MRASLVAVMWMALLGATSSACAGERQACNLADVLFGEVRIDLIPHDTYETGIIFGNAFDAKRFQRGHILGQINAPERDGSRSISDANNEPCGLLSSNGSIDPFETNCDHCPGSNSVEIKKDGKAGFVVIYNEVKQGSIQGRLPK